MDKNTSAARASSGLWDQPFTPPPGPSLALPLLVVVLVVVGAVWAYQQRDHGWASPAALVAAPQPSPAPPPTPRTGAQPPPLSAQAPAQAPAAETGPKKCLLQGRTSYTDGPCPSQAQAQPLVLAPNSGWTGGATALSAQQTLFLCRAFNGARVWTRERCDPQRALIERTASVSARLTFDEQVQAARRQRDEAASRMEQASSGERSVLPSDGKAQECRYLNDQVAHWDALAREPQPATEQDRIRGQRKAARDRQFVLRC
jgi:hypothetical protein